MLFNRKKAKLPSDQRSTYNGKLKEVQQIFDLSSDVDGSDIKSEKGKKVEIGTWDSTDEVKNLHDSSVNKAAELAAGSELRVVPLHSIWNLFANALAGLASNDMIQRTTGRLDTLHSEGVHRLSELCCFAVTQLLFLPVLLQALSDVAEAYLAAIKGASSGSQDSQKSIQEKANVYSGDLRAEHNTAIGKIQDA
ncbi:hypothetical protein K7X08_006980 [Anisodus acutangulus]|uniref:DUF7798 domain-containing protein n=1 Tax=Anisodus acutangulus TaxID=402998 RepID=A0A9Q1QZ14_9SOLA|nr:hypothetical protein K7X08_006980 [Anisodus acutangulus]